MTTARLMVGALCLALVTVWSPAASAQQNPGQAKKYNPTRAITVDDQTGALRLPTAQETQTLVDRLVALTNRSTDGLQVSSLPNGVAALNLDGRFAPVMLARPNPDGTSEVRCVTSFEEAADFLGLVEDKSQQ
jgi:hypothetical protein